MPDRIADRARAVLSCRWLRWALCLGLPTVAAVQHLLLEHFRGPRFIDGLPYTHFNNFMIFRWSFLHLAQGADLYASFPADHFDYFKYSPTFAAAMAPFALLPVGVGLLLWNLLNGAVLLAALERLPGLSPRTRGLMALFLAPELLTSSQNAQCNLLIAGLLLLAFCRFEQGRVGWAALALVAVFDIKLFGAVAGLAFLLYPRKPRFVLMGALWLLALGVVPLLFVSVSRLEALYRSWAALLQADHSAVIGVSVMGWLKTWFGLEPSKLGVVAVGAALALAPLFKRAASQDAAFRRLYFASLLIWMIIFNHRAESATFIIAMTGVALWFFPLEHHTRWELALAVVALVFTSLSPTDVFPAWAREHLVRPYVLQTVPCVAVWGLITIRLLRWPMTARPIAAQ